MRTTDRRDFDLPTDLHSEEGTGHYTLRKAREPDLIALRRSRRPGANILFDQATGTSVMKRVIEIAGAAELSEFSRRRLGASAFNGAWYSNARGADQNEWGDSVMRRRLKLPVHFRKPDENPVSYSSLIQDAVTELTIAEDYGLRYATSYNNKNCTILNNRALYSRSIGRAALIIGSTFEIDKITSAMSREEQQESAMHGAMRIRHDATHLKSIIGAIPSPAQFASFDSELAVDWRRNGSNVEVEALEQAMTEVI